MGYFLFQIALFCCKIRTRMLLLKFVENMLPAVYMSLLLAFSLAKYFCKIGNFY
jgi:hypothetical protein